MKKFLKFFAVVSCFVMIFSMTAFAADSPSAGSNSATNSPDTGNNSATEDNSSSTTGSNSSTANNGSTASNGVTAPKVMFNGKELEVTIGSVSTADVDNAKAVAKEYFGASAQVLNVFDVTLPEGDYSAGVDVTLNIPSVKAGQSISVLHWNGSIWENLKVTDIKDGSVTATFTSFSPVAVVLNATAPSTGYEMPVGLIAVILVCAAGAVFCFRRKAIAR